MVSQTNIMRKWCCYVRLSNWRIRGLLKKAEEEQEARDKRTRARILEAVYQVRLASAETEKELFFAAFGIQDNDENGQNDR